MFFDIEGKINELLVQGFNISACHAEDQGFESPIARKKKFQGLELNETEKGLNNSTQI